MPAEIVSTDRTKQDSYREILRASSIIGGAQGINYLIGMVRTKLVAVLLGPTGVGLLGLYISATGLVGTIAGMGIGSSGVREISEAHGSGDPQRMAHSLKTLRRACWITGILGWILTAAFSYPLSVWTFNSPEYAWAIALLGVTTLFGSISSGQSALIQGTRRIGDLARLSVIGVLAGTTVAVVLYWFLGEKGVVPVLITTAALNLGFTWWFARKIHILKVDQSFAETWQNSKRLLRLGLAFMWSGLLSAAVSLAIRSIIVRTFGLEANGIYQAAWGISGMFAGFILGAMGTDFYPRLTAIADDHPAMVRLVNEQTEIGILLALPGLVGTLIFAPWVMKIFYSSQFLPGGELLPWFVLGIFGRVISWPLGFIVLALGAGKWFVFSETLFSLGQLVLTFWMVKNVGLWGVGIAFALLYLFCTVFWVFLSRHLIAFQWSKKVVIMLAESTFFVGVAFLARRFLPEWATLCLGGTLSAASVFYTLKGLTVRFGRNHKITRFMSRIPGFRLIF